MLKVLKYDCFHVTLKISYLLASKVALFCGKSLLIQHIMILTVLFLLESFVENKGYLKMVI